VQLLKTLFLRAQNPATLRDFYTNILGMVRLDNACIGYGGNETNLCFLPAEAPYGSNPNDLYWKIAIAVPNIELACRQLAEKGVAIEPPRQFQDIGYLAHCKDSEGFTIELIEHWFEGNRPSRAWDQHRLGGGPHLNLITLRAAQIEPIQIGCGKLGMKPLAVQPVENYGFTLYFFAFTDESPPSKELTALENREWLYQRPYSILEIQHVHRLATVLPPAPGRAGYDHLLVTGTNPNLAMNQLRLQTTEK
jgi:predicted enzyme related to lactoylglutathione lyase